MPDTTDDAKRASESAAETVDSAVDRAAQTVESAAQSVSDTAADASAAVQDARASDEPTSKELVEKLGVDWDASKERLYNGLTDLKNVVLYPLATGIMTGVGFVAGKRFAERYFYPDHPVA